ncbi:MAG: glycosyl transferase [Ruminococcaceae bacterium]|nr:glycosyl transferase [Oscillospiraceae bacterium]
MAHSNFDQLKILISLLDDVRNDIYLHIDKKVTDFSPESIKTKFSELFLVDPISVIWGGHSQIACEMLLFKAAAPKHYAYYHVISGVDLPLKNQNEIHTFFKENYGKNFISFDEKAIKNRRFVGRTQYYHFFQNFAGRSQKPFRRFLRFLDKISVGTQVRLHIKRKEIVPLYKGENWVSITDEMVQYVLQCEKVIKKQFYYSRCGDEVFLQSLAMQSPHKTTIVNNSLRETEWSRGSDRLNGSPYIYRTDDVPKLLASQNLFARKFDSTVDIEAIRLIADSLSENEKNDGI